MTERSERPASGSGSVFSGSAVHSGVIEILVVCTGNTCRSPMAEALLRHELAQLGIEASVSSAGTLPWPGGASAGARAALGERGIDLSAHRSRALDAEMVARADLVLAMTRNHAWAVASHDDDAATRTFLPAELVRLAGRVGERAAGEPVDAWAARLAAQRGDPRVPGHPQDEVADPAGQPLDVYRMTAERLAGELARVARLIGGPVGGAEG